MKSSTSTITIHSKIDPKTFYAFAVFDTLSLRKRWISPAIFAGIFLLCSLICFSMHAKVEGAALLGAVLLIVGLGVPAVYFGTFFHSLYLQSKALKLKKAALAYTVQLDEKGVHVTSNKSDGGAASFHWQQIFRVYMRPGCIYLYVSPTQAFLLPKACADASPEELTKMLAAHIRPENIHTIK